MIPDVTPNGVFYLPPTGWLTSFYNPPYFYEHPITLSNQQKKELKKRLGNIDNLKITGLDLHFDGHNGDHLLLYAKTNQQIIYLVGIGSHSDLF